MEELSPSEIEMDSQSRANKEAEFIKYRNLGQYDKAIAILEELIHSFPLVVGYYIDMGDTYLQGLDRPKEAIKYFWKVVELNPDLSYIYAYIALCYERLGELEEAKKFYQKSLEFSTNLYWFSFAKSHLLAIKLAQESFFVTDWYVIGPFSYELERGLDTVYPPEKDVKLDSVYEGDIGLVTWSKIIPSENLGYVNLNSMFSPNDNTIAYALTYAYSAEDRTIEVRIGSDDGVMAWVNGKMVLKREVFRTASLDQNIVRTRFSKGWNMILLKIAETSGSWGFYFRITDMQGFPIEDIVFDTERDEVRAKNVIKDIHARRMLELAGIGLIVVIAGVFISWVFVYLGIRIYQKIETRRMQQRFMLNVSHELKTPLTAMQISVETLQQSRIKDPEKNRRYLNHISGQVSILTQFIENILSFSKIKRGVREYDLKKQDIVEIVKESIAFFSTAYIEKTPNIKSTFGTSPVYVNIDKDAIIHVVLNLLNNAHHYSDKNQPIDVIVRCEPKTRYAVIEVVDRGIGIPRKEIKRIYGEFYRGKRGSGYWSKGSGLGLALTRYLVKAHKGYIEVQSTINKGSRFIVRLPLYEQ
ncbi:tetratricopeptide repeat protein [bacterium]|nr:tetratricopeptide repeat protein [bacterium]